MDSTLFSSFSLHICLPLVFSSIPTPFVESPEFIHSGVKFPSGKARSTVADNSASVQTPPGRIPRGRELLEQRSQAAWAVPVVKLWPRDEKSLHRITMTTLV